MPSRICACCSELTPAVESEEYRWPDIANVELLRADIFRTAAVRRPGHVVAWKQLPAAPDGTVPAAPDPVLPWGFRKTWLYGLQDHDSGFYAARPEPAAAAAEADHAGGTAGANGTTVNTGAYGSAEDAAETLLAPAANPGRRRRRRSEASDVDTDSDVVAAANRHELHQDDRPEHEIPSYPCRDDVLPRPDPQDSTKWLVAYCMRIERDGENRTVRLNEAAEDLVTICNGCNHALERKRAAGRDREGNLDLRNEWLAPRCAMWRATL
jgi:hypothetical protein